jgi:hypothetical protein
VSSPSSKRMSRTAWLGVLTIIGVGVFLIGAVTRAPLLYILAIVAELAAFSVWFISLLKPPSNDPPKKSVIAYHVGVGLCALAPVGATAIYVVYIHNDTIGSVLFTTTVGAATLFMAAFYAATLESNVKGWRRENLKLGFSFATLGGAALTGISAIFALL